MPISANVGHISDTSLAIGEVTIKLLLFTINVFLTINIGCKLTPEGREYRGNISSTRCQAWSSQTPNQHDMTDPDQFPDNTLEEAQNFCRNPSRHESGPWCFDNTHAPLMLMCDVPFCDSINTRMIYFVTRSIHI